ncbi:MAG: 3-hydroxyacyl-CoA dehydrogenase/enoyl-CoA hydratase family protein [Proteobacteria bacterium]|nr:3-hydroxyacyl-CoA dehydrogenase/enoyl-CoA hydratase family protein [Pseudomonadota bacterium]
MEKKIEKAGVIGAGVMGATIAAHLSNVGIETVLLDILPPGGLTEKEKKKGLTEESPEFRNRLGKIGVDIALKSKPASFYISDTQKLIKVGNLKDNLDWLGEVDWIIEVVVEDIKIKDIVFKQIETVLKPGTVVTSNTSGIFAEAMCEGRSETFRKHFAITHFFNPPRYMKLLEIVPGPDTLPEVTKALAEVCENRLGKGVVWAKDTPNFVANRVGIFGMHSIIYTMVEMGMTVEAVDKLTGPVVGHANSATFRTGDLVGLDTLAHVAENVYDGAPNDERRDMFKSPDFMLKMVEKNLLGEKNGNGFYKKTTDAEGKRQILSIDYKTTEYTPQEKVKLGSLEAAKPMEDLDERIKTLYYAKDKGGEFTFKTLTETVIYSANRIPEIADDIVNIDNSMKWGFGQEKGPFESWDAIGVGKSVEKMKEAGYEIPGWVQEMLDGGSESFYKSEAGVNYFYDVASKGYKEVELSPKIILLPSLKEREKKILSNSGATLVDIGDGVACLEFHTKMNAIGEDIVRMMDESADEVSKNFDGLVIANHDPNFSVGANLPLILFTAQEEEWDDLEYMVKSLQDTFMKVKLLDKPVVAAPAGMTLGGGCEVCLAADCVRFAAETYMGLVEAGVGLLPAGGGTKELLLRNTEHLFAVGKGGLYPRQIELMPFIARAFETIGMAKVAVSGPEAVQFGILRSTDRMTVNRDYLIDDAKKTVLAMNLQGYAPPRMRDDIRVAGENAMAYIKLGLWSMHESGLVLDHDKTVAEKIAWVLCGGNVLENTVVSEQYLLDLEREAFLSLCGEPLTQARIQHMLDTGKPLRN